jgi:CPA1 family monovalent cation:H+ antiporter
MKGMPSLLLFAGALHVDLSEVGADRWQIGVPAVLATLLSTLAVGFGTWVASPWVGLESPSTYCVSSLQSSAKGRPSGV